MKLIEELIHKILPKKINPYYYRWRARRKTAIEELIRGRNQDRLLKALEMLFDACEPLTTRWDQASSFIPDIAEKAFYCSHVKQSIKDGVEPLSWEDWRDTSKKDCSLRRDTEKMEKIKPTEKPDPVSLDELKNALGTDYLEYPSKTPRKDNNGFIVRYSNDDAVYDEVRLTARCYGGHED